MPIRRNTLGSALALTAVLWGAGASAADEVDVDAHLAAGVKASKELFTAAARDILGYSEADAEKAWEERQDWYVLGVEFQGEIAADGFKLEKPLAAKPATVFTDYDDFCEGDANAAALQVVSAYEVTLADRVAIDKDTVLDAGSKSLGELRLTLARELADAPASWTLDDRAYKTGADVELVRSRKTLIADYTLAPGTWHETTVLVDAVAQDKAAFAGDYVLSGDVAVEMVARACLYKNKDFEGGSACFTRDGAVRRSFNNKAESLELPQGAGIFLHRDRDLKGARKYFQASDSDLNDDRENLTDGKSWAEVTSGADVLDGRASYRIDADDPGPWKEAARIPVTGKAKLAGAFNARLETRSGKCGDKAQKALLKAAGDAATAKAEESEEDKARAVPGRRRFEIPPPEGGPAQVTRR